MLYAANGGSIDNDDGSSRYLIHHNVFVYGGHKSDFDGHSKASYNNLNAYAQVYGDKCVGIAIPLPGFNEVGSKGKHWLHSPCFPSNS